MKKLLILLFIVPIVNLAGQDRSFLRAQIDKWGSCKNVAITATGGDVALYGRDGYAYTGATPAALKDKLKELNQNGELIDDVVITEGGGWLVLFGDNGASWDGIPLDLESKIREFNNKNYVITSVTFNDSGDWLIISNEFIAYSAWIKPYVERGQKYGVLWAGHITDDRSLVLVFEKGYVYEGNVPATLKTKLETSGIDVYRVKFLENGVYFFADKDGNCRYFM